MQTTFLLIFAGGVLLLAIFGLLVVNNFVRYRFVGDRTFLFIFFMGVGFAILTLNTILLIRNIPADPSEKRIPIIR